MKTTPVFQDIVGNTINPADTVTLKLSQYQARLVRAAIYAEIRQGGSTFLSGRDVVNLGRMLESIDEQLAAAEETV
jgi:hypothetical protein